MVFDINVITVLVVYCTSFVDYHKRVIYRTHRSSREGRNFAEFLPIALLLSSFGQMNTQH